MTNIEDTCRGCAIYVKNKYCVYEPSKTIDNKIAMCPCIECLIKVMCINSCELLVKYHCCISTVISKYESIKGKRT